MGIKVRHHARWRIDHTYQRRLSPAERDWLARFDAEYHRGEFGPNPLHNDAQRREIQRDHYAARNDAATAHPEQLATAATPRRPCLAVRVYEPDDYAMMREASAGDVEDALVEACDEAA